MDPKSICYMILCAAILYFGTVALSYWLGTREGKEQAKEDYDRKLKARAIERRQTAGERWRKG